MFVGYYSEVTEAVEKVVEDVHENAPVVPEEEAAEEVKAPAEEEAPKQPETAAPEPEELPVENGKEAEVSAEEKAEPEVGEYLYCNHM